MPPTLVGVNIDTFIGNARIGGDFPDDLAGELDDLKLRSQEAEEDIPTGFTFAGETLYALALSSGMRRSAILGLQWSEVDFENHLLRVRW